MKKFFLLFAFSTLLLIGACSNEEAASGDKNQAGEKEKIVIGTCSHWFFSEVSQ